MVLQNTHPMIGTCGTLSWQLVEVYSTLFLKFLKIVIFCYFYLLMCMYDTPPETFAFIFLLLLSSQVNLRLIIMWSVPFNFNLRDSYYAIGLTHNKVSVG